ncbi:MAG: peptidase M28, partial [Chitinophagaceae bacterium]
MKKLIYTLIAACTVQYATAQELEKIVTKDYVDNLIKTLASDAMEGRRPGTPGIEKAATFIEGEFKAIGLKPLAGLKGFRQSFDKYQVKSQSVKVTVNGKAVADENVYISGVNSEKTNFDHTTGDGVIVLDTAKTFQAQVRALARGKKQLIIVPAKFAGDIKRQKSFGARPGTFDGKDMSKPTANVFVISDEGQAATFSVEGINT